ncbi:leucine--tRNA ligase [Luteimicrobium xylanilyticum]|uniref:Leucine--tRNA ligase n=1 Tax=Luteimicrobium xylanilyticum TaxID=1133546 RepID=A0A5P9QB91_9MICO|nr:leucine--tRNA ligase [Luteimicrobium xylanilyticum]QFU98721.1 Leucine--tRNA ligase [Luteimicrobium xylanilyticum]
MPAQPAPGSDELPFRYTPQLAERIELAWQDEWAQRGTFWAANPQGALTDGEDRHAAPGAQPFFLMDMFPYPSGAGLHVGHPLGYIATDVVGRYRRMRGDNVLHALGYDAFGLPAEQYAVQTGQHPRTTTEANMATMKRQLRRLGLAHDERRSFATIDPGYVRWTQWIFLQIFSSWYDPDAERPGGGRGAARPITELVESFESGARPTPDGRPWADLTPAEREDVLGEYRLAYVSEAPVNWCPGLGTVLANEEVTSDGRSERGNFPVFQRSLRQWNMRITAYADRLADDLDLIDWPEKVKSMQRNWIGRSEGARVTFAVGGVGDANAREVEVFTTRPDTLFGATFMVVAPEHPLLDEVPAAWPDGTKDLWTGGHDTPGAAVSAYRSLAASKTAVERQADARSKSGVFTGHLATNPVNGELVPVFTADYVLMGYGTGAIMAVPGGDQRDFDFARAYDLPVVFTVAPDGGFADGFEEAPDAAYTGDGLVQRSSATTTAGDELSLDGLTVPEAKARITAWLEANGVGQGTVTYRLRDWLFSRQRYWGEPFPIVYGEDGAPVALPDSLLPVELPDVPDYAPRTFAPDDVTSAPEPPLGRNEEWVNVTLDLGDGPKTYRRETNTMPNWAGSCWYYLRYLDPADQAEAVSPELEKYWLGPGHRQSAGGSTDRAGGVDLYVGGVEHAVLHLLYARFWHKVLFDLGHVSALEPFHTLFNQGYIQAYAYTDARGQYVPAAEVEEHTEGTGETARTVFTWHGEPVNREYGKMGKSLKNVVTPDEMYEQYGADTFRVYEMSMGPLDMSRPWETRAVVGSQRFLQRLWRNVVDEATGDVVVVEAEPDAIGAETLRLVHRTIADVTVEMEHMRPNTAIAKLITLNNHLTGLDRVPRAAVEPLVLMTAPVAPHIAEELWKRLGHDTSLAHEPFPEADPAYLVEETVTCVVQVQGKVRARLEVPPSIAEDALRELALADENVQKHLDGRGVRTVIVRAPKLVNVVPA